MGRILIVDDDAYTLKVVGTFLTQLGHEVFQAEDGEEAVRMALQHRPDLIILDVMMPKKNGFQVLEELRRFRRTQQTPVLMLSGLNQQWDRDEARRRGAAGYLTKPLNRAELMSCLQMLMPG
jgi:DNA-binding response OmpR family regulator